MSKTYVVAPNFSIHPAPDIEGGKPITHEGRLQLGDVLTDPFGPKPIALNRYDRTKVDKKYIEIPDNKGKTEIKARDLFSGRLGVWASLLASLGIGAAVDVGIHAKKVSSDVLTIESLVTYDFDARDDYIRDVLASKSVANYAKKFSDKVAPPKPNDDSAQKTTTANKKKKPNVIPLYMICGLKIAKGASSKLSDLAEASMTAGASGNVDLKLLDFLWKRYRGVSFETSTDFVLAYELLHINYDIETKEIDVSVSTKHATLADGTTAAVTDAPPQYIGKDQDFSGAMDESREILETRDEAGSELVMVPDVE